MNTERRAAELSDYPDLVVITLGMKAHSLRGLRTLLGLRKEVARAVRDQPDGLLHHDTLIITNWPVHRLLRQYWRDLDCLERWTRSMPHSAWWRRYIRDSAGTSFYHELYARRGGMEGIFVNMDGPVGMMHFAPVVPAHGPMFGSRGRLGLSEGQPQLLTETELARG